MLNVSIRKKKWGRIENEREKKKGAKKRLCAHCYRYVRWWWHHLLNKKTICIVVLLKKFSCVQYFLFVEDETSDDDYRSAPVIHYYFHHYRRVEFIYLDIFIERQTAKNKFVASVCCFIFGSYVCSVCVDDSSYYLLMS